ncbi:unnamed protein product [Rotaria sp. Silwood2]|nr:unnamed protein product [Rotaria sp. Silwood2]CAF2798082.1 unnamed protein product [Rotaria sp. Silwood2]CAF2927077.1 unnamed protein product [Rotaria sp. Silwood2]CAF3954814.1 unnamed protein product [Rotaria sp. Silwood2]
MMASRILLYSKTIDLNFKLMPASEIPSSQVSTGSIPLESSSAPSLSTMTTTEQLTSIATATVLSLPISL